MTAVVFTFLLGLITGVLVIFGSRGKPEESSVSLIDSLLPQTQCGQCDHAGCKPYAMNILNGTADINQCPPGGAITIHQLSSLLGREKKFLNIKHGREKKPFIAVIDEGTCIGCVKCIKACPVDAIVGAAKVMHTVIFDHCTGCELCVEPCPVNCIAMQPPDLNTQSPYVAYL